MLYVSLKGLLSGMTWDHAKFIAEIVSTLVAGGSAALAAKTYWANSSRERAKWAVQLYEKFYETDRYRKVRDDLDEEPDNLATLWRVAAEDDDFIDYLNFFELVVFLARSKQLSWADASSIFGYYLNCIKSHKSVMTYIDDPSKDFEQLREHLGCVDWAGWRDTRRFLFAYGTLRADHIPEEIRPVIQQCRRVNAATVPGVLYDIGGFPGAALRPNSSSQIAGEVLELSSSTNALHQLDVYEEFDPSSRDRSLFTRVQYPVSLRSGETLICWIYVLNRDPGSAPVIPTGDWNERTDLSSESV
jgi:gamma-glutamylcyclotransferase (GGCT)/AIG2-like uncharacterized protein YtfP